MHRPLATYRLQLTPAFPFSAVEGLTAYFRALGVSDLYFSPMFASKPGSNHGYDVVDMNTINTDLGGEAGFESLRQRMHDAGLGWIQDVVPNHQAFFGTNPILSDILENGPHSRFYQYFDIMWDHPYENIRGRLLAPFLGDFYSRVLERGELKLTFGPEGFRVGYWELKLPIRLESYTGILGHDLARLKSRAGSAEKTLARYIAILQFLRHLKAERRNSPDFEHAGFIKSVLWELYNEEELIRQHLDETIAHFNGGDPDNPDYEPLDSLLSHQYFRLSYWKVGTQELNYRRFFSINDLISLCVEKEEVLEHTHALLFRLAREGKVQGFRIDHVDGLYDPTQYLERLRAMCPECYLTAEKILEPGEELPSEWPIQGTTGYDFMDAAGGVLCDETNAEAMEELYREFSRFEEAYEDMVRENKRHIIGRHMAGDIDNLAIALKNITNRNRQGNDLTMYAVRRALVEILTVFPIYRTYVNDSGASKRDLDVIREVLRKGKETAPHFTNELELIGTAILDALEGRTNPEDRHEWTQLIMRLQQYTGPLMAKGVEDTTFYVYNRLIARNEVGSDPEIMAYSPEEFHSHNLRRLEQWPHAMNATSTHDTKRGEDTRARLYVLSEEPREFDEHLRQWRTANTPHKRRVGRREAPTPNDEYHLYQTILGTAPFEDFHGEDFPERLREYMVKAVREGKDSSGWLNPNTEYEEALTEFIDSILDPKKAKEFLASFSPFCKRVAGFGIVNSLTQTLLKLTSPGVPDIYQGAEMWDFSLVDPDNRRPVDYERRKETLEYLRSQSESNLPALIDELKRSPQDGRLKLYLTWRALGLRRVYPEVFREGDYQPVIAQGEKARHVIAYSRSCRGRHVLVAGIRLPAQLLPEPRLETDSTIWGETRLLVPDAAAGEYEDILTGRRITLARSTPAHNILGPLPVALLTRA